MIHQTTTRFWNAYNNLQPQIQNLADKSFYQLRNNPKHPALQFKKVGKFYSARVGLSHRALAIKDDNGFIWVWIGSHDEYDRLIS
jgi:hypothetical protein